MTAPARYRCRTCGAEFVHWAPSERHADAEHHHRVELILSPARPDQPRRTR